MKRNKKRTLGFQNNGRRKTDRRKDKHIEKYLDDYMDEYDIYEDEYGTADPEEAAGLDEGDEYIVDYIREDGHSSSEYGYEEYGDVGYTDDGGAEDAKDYYGGGYSDEGDGEYGSDEYYDDGYYDDGYYDDGEDEAFDISYGEHSDPYDNDIFSSGPYAGDTAAERGKNWLRSLTAFDVILIVTGVIVVAVAAASLFLFLWQGHLDKQVEDIAPLGVELENMGIVGGDGLVAMADAALSGNFDETPSPEDTSAANADGSGSGEDDGGGDKNKPGKVSVSFISVEKDLKIRFTDEHTGELITGTAFEVTLTDKKGKKLVLSDDDKDGIIYAQNINAGVFDAVIASTEKYSFPTAGQQVTVKGKVEYVVINVQDEVKTEKQVNVAKEDTQKKDAAVEAEVLKDTVEWVESSKTPVNGTESYLLVDKNTIADPSKVSAAAARMLFDALNVSLESKSVTLVVGSSAELKGTDFSDSKDGDVEYKYTKEWKSSDGNVASVDGGKVTAKAEGTAVITYTVTRKTITTTYETKEPVEETREIEVKDYEKLSEEEKKKCTPIKDDAGQIIGYTYKKVTEPEKKTSETVDTASAECTVKVEAAKAASASLELTKSAESCAIGGTIAVKPSKLVYKKQDGSQETVTEKFPEATWESADKGVATVDAKGVVTGVAAGKTKITCKMAGIKDADGKEIDVSCSVEVTITEGVDLALALDRTKDVYIAVGGSTTLVATVTGHKDDAGVTWETSDKKIATVDEKGKVTGVAAGSVKITAVTKEKNKKGEHVKAECVVTVNSNAHSDTTTKLKDKNGNQIYVKNADGTYREAVYADYFGDADFYIVSQPQYIYTGWQTIDGKTYYYDKNGTAVTGTQIIQGVTYDFGTDGAIATKANGSTFGIDISRHNGKIDWNAVKASGVDYAIIRCGYRGSATGVLIEDQTFKTNIKGAAAAGIKVGVYVFSQAVNEVEAVKEASLAVSLVQGYNLTYPIFIDTESSGGRADKLDKATRTAVVNAFCQTVAGAGYKPGIYASKSWFEDKLNMGAVGNYKIWLAQYSSAPTYKGRYDMWQYSDKGKISGISTAVDLNHSYLGY